MNNEPYPWRAHPDLASILRLAHPVFASLGAVDPNEGCTEAEIADAERRMQRPLPQDVRDFYRAIRPKKLFGKGAKKSFGFYPIESVQLAWRPMKDAEPSEDWAAANGLALGQSLHGDPFWWVEKHRSLPEGSIVLLDHDGGLGGDIAFVHFARSFREFVAKLLYFKDLYGPASDALFRGELAELNPTGGF